MRVSAATVTLGNGHMNATCVTHFGFSARGKRRVILDATLSKMDVRNTTGGVTTRTPRGSFSGCLTRAGSG